MATTAPSTAEFDPIGRPQPSGPAEIPARLPAVPIDRVFAGGRDLIGTGQMHFVLKFEGPIDAERLRRAVRLSVDAEPILGCRWVETWFRPHWQRCSDLDQLELFRIVEVDEEGQGSEAVDEALQQFMVTPNDPQLAPPIRVELVRGRSDSVAIKIDHMVGDGRSLIEYVYLLARLYTRLETEPNYVPAPNLSSRDVRQIARRVPMLDRLRIVLKVLQHARNRRELFPGPWQFPTVQDGPANRVFLFHKLSAERMQRIREYRKEHSATVSEVLMAAFFRAMDGLIPRVPDRTVLLPVPIDLRRYLPENSPVPIGNLSGAIRVTLGLGPSGSIEQVIDDIHQQIEAQQTRYMGLDSIAFVLEAFAPLRALFHCVPLPLYQRFVRYQIKSKVAQVGNAGIGVLSNVGQLDPAPMTFGQVEVADVVLAGGIPLVPGVVLMGTIGFRGAVIFSVGLSEDRMDRETVERIFQRMDEELPG